MEPSPHDGADDLPEHLDDHRDPEHLDQHALNPHRITPARTGNGGPFRQDAYLNRDHPRAYGERSEISTTARPRPVRPRRAGAALNRWTTTGPQFVEHARRRRPDPSAEPVTPQRIEPEHRQHLLYLPVECPERYPVPPITLSEHPEPERYPFIDTLTKHLDDVRVNVQERPIVGGPHTSPERQTCDPERM